MPPYRLGNWLVLFHLRNLCLFFVEEEERNSSNGQPQEVDTKDGVQVVVIGELNKDWA